MRACTRTPRSPLLSFLRGLRFVRAGIVAARAIRDKPVLQLEPLSWARLLCLRVGFFFRPEVCMKFQKISFFISFFFGSGYRFTLHEYFVVRRAVEEVVRYIRKEVEHFLCTLLFYVPAVKLWREII